MEKTSPVQLPQCICPKSWEQRWQTCGYWTDLILHMPEKLVCSCGRLAMLIDMAGTNRTLIVTQEIGVDFSAQAMEYIQQPLRSYVLERIQRYGAAIDAKLTALNARLGLPVATREKDITETVKRDVWQREMLRVAREVYYEAPDKFFAAYLPYNPIPQDITIFLYTLKYPDKDELLWSRVRPEIGMEYYRAPT